MFRHRLLVLLGACSLMILVAASNPQGRQSIPQGELGDSEGAKRSYFVVKLRSREAIAALSEKNDKHDAPFLAAAVDKRETLSLPLLATVASGGQLCGYTRSGKWIIQAPPAAWTSLGKSGLVESIESDVPADFSPVRELVLVYSKEAKPSAELLANCQLIVLKDRGLGESGYMKVRYTGKASGIPAQLAEIIRKTNGVSKADVNTSVIIESPPDTPKDVRPNRDLPDSTGMDGAVRVSGG